MRYPFHHLENHLPYPWVQTKPLRVGRVLDPAESLVDFTQLHDTFIYLPRSPYLGIRKP